MNAQNGGRHRKARNTTSRICPQTIAVAAMFDPPAAQAGGRVIIGCGQYLESLAKKAWAAENNNLPHSKYPEIRISKSEGNSNSESQNIPRNPRVFELFDDSNFEIDPDFVLRISNFGRWNAVTYCFTVPYQQGFVLVRPFKAVKPYTPDPKTKS
jgi:hypothetical protein